MAKIRRIPAITNGNLLFPSCSGLKSDPAGDTGGVIVGAAGMEEAAGALHAGVAGAAGVEAGVPQLADPATGVGAGEENEFEAGAAGADQAGAAGAAGVDVSVEPKEGTDGAAAGGVTGAAGTAPNGWTGGVSETPGTGGTGFGVAPNPPVVVLVSFIELLLPA